MVILQTSTSNFKLSTQSISHRGYKSPHFMYSWADRACQWHSHKAIFHWNFQNLYATINWVGPEILKILHCGILSNLLKCNTTYPLRGVSSRSRLLCRVSRHHIPTSHTVQRSLLFECTRVCCVISSGSRCLLQVLVESSDLTPACHRVTRSLLLTTLLCLTCHSWNHETSGIYQQEPNSISIQSDSWAWVIV